MPQQRRIKLLQAALKRVGASHMLRDAEGQDESTAV